MARLPGRQLFILFALVAGEAILIGIAAFAAIGAAVCEEGCANHPEVAILVLLGASLVLLAAAWWRLGRLAVERSRAGGSTGSTTWLLVVGSVLVWVPWLVVGSYLIIQAPGVADPGQPSELAFAVAIGPSILLLATVSTLIQTIRVGRSLNPPLDSRATIAVGVGTVLVVLALVPEYVRAVGTFRDKQYLLALKSSYEPIARFSYDVYLAQSEQAVRTGRLIDFRNLSTVEDFRQMPDWQRVAVSHDPALITGATSKDGSRSILRMTVGESVFEMRFRIDHSDDEVGGVVSTTACKGPPLCGHLVPTPQHFFANDPRTSTIECALDRDSLKWCSSYDLGEQQ